MKKNNFLFVLSLFLVLVSFKNAHAYQGTEVLVDTTIYQVSKGYSTVNWTGYKLGGQHTGKIAVSDGQLFFKDTTLIGGNFEIDMNSISNTDLTDTVMAKKLVDHLKSPDFFDSKTFPKATFKIEKIIPYGKVEDIRYKYKVVGPLTLKGVSKKLNFEADLFLYDSGSCSVTGRLFIDRSDFNVKYNSGTFFDNLGDKIIYDRVLLDVNLSAVK